MTYKKNCVSCGKSISPTKKHYNQYGSYCQECTTRARIKAIGDMGGHKKKARVRIRVVQETLA